MMFVFLAVLLLHATHCLLLILVCKSSFGDEYQVDICKCKKRIKFMSFCHKTTRETKYVEQENSDDEGIGCPGGEFVSFF